MKAAGDGKKKKKMSIERIYQKKTQLEHILLRPDTYIGSTEKATQSMWVYDQATEGMVQREITYVPGLYKIYDEILGAVKKKYLYYNYNLSNAREKI